MKKFFNLKNGIIFGVIVLISIITVSSCFALMPRANMKPSDYDLGLTYEKASQEDKPILAVFYVDWCTYCKRFMPKLDTIRNVHKEFNVVLINVEDPTFEKMVKEYRIGGYPTVYIIDPKYDNRVHIDNAFLDSVATLNKEVSRYSSFRKLITKGESCK